MTFLRISAYVLPQLLLILFVAGSNDLLGGWNQTDDAMATLLALFLLAPLLAFALMMTEIVHRWRTRTGKSCRALTYIAVSILIFVESLAIDFYLLTQVRMH